MKKLLRKWTLALRRRRIRKQVRALGSHKATELQTREAGIDCNNCGAPLSGPFCHICGQRDDDFKRPFWMLLKEILDNVFSADSRLIKTLFLLVLVPGGLTRAFIDGRRARFVPPLRLYITVSIVFFIILEIADVLILDIHVTPSLTADEVVQKRDEALKERDKALQEVAKALEPEHLPAEPGQQSALPETSAPPAQPEAGSETGPEVVTETGPEAGSATESSVQSLLPPEARKALQDAIDKGELEDLLENLEGGDEESGAPDDGIGTTENGLDEVDRARLRKIETAMSMFDRFGVTPTGIDAEPAVILAQAQKLLADGSAEVPPEIRSMLDRMERDKNRGPVKVSVGDGDFNLDLPYDFDVGMFVKDGGEIREGFKQEDIDKILNDPDVPAFVKDATRGFARALRQPQQMNRLFNDWLPRALFVLLPVFALILRVFHWGKERYYLHQIVFSLHFHSFLFLLLTALVIVVPRYGAEQGAMLFWWGTSLYLVIALKVGQNQGIIRAFFKAGFIWVSYFIVMMSVIFGMVLLGLREL